MSDLELTVGLKRKDLIYQVEHHRLLSVQAILEKLELFLSSSNGTSTPGLQKNVREALGLVDMMLTNPQPWEVPGYDALVAKIREIEEPQGAHAAHDEQTRYSERLDAHARRGI